MPLLLFQRKQRYANHNVLHLRELYASLLSIVNEEQSEELAKERIAMKMLWEERSAYHSYHDNDYDNDQPSMTESIQHQSNKPLLIDKKARDMESNVVELIRSIGEIVIYGEKKHYHTNVVSLSSQRPPHDSSTHSTNDDDHDDIPKDDHVSVFHQEVFEYFCEKNMLALLVDLLLAKPSTSIIHRDLHCGDLHCHCHHQHHRRHDAILVHSSYTGVTWTALVKAQILQTISIFVSNVSDTKSLYYLLSNNYINRIITNMVPLEQWSDMALDEILPIYISFLKTMALLLANKPDLFPFFVCRFLEEEDEDDGVIGTSCSSSSMPLFPLFHAAVHIATSSSKVASSDYLVQTTALNIILNICQLKHAEISSIVSKSRMEQQWLIDHLCLQLNQKYHSIVDILMIDNGNRISPWRQEALTLEHGQLEEILQFITDLLWSLQSWNEIVSQRFCEGILSKVLMNPILLHCHDYYDNHHDTNEKTHDGSPETQAKYHASLFFLSSFFRTIDYIPLVRMVVVAIFHPFTPRTKFIHNDDDDDKGNTQNQCRNGFYITPTLNAIAQHNYTIVQEEKMDKNGAFMEEQEYNDTHNTMAASEGTSSQVPVVVVSNPIQKLMYQTLSGEFGDIAFVLVATVLQTILSSTVMDLNMLQQLGMISSPSCHLLTPCLLEDSLTKYYSNLKHNSTQKSGHYALNMAISMTTLFITKQMEACTEVTNLNQSMQAFNSLLTSISAAKHHFVSYGKDFYQNNHLSSELLPDLIERKIKEIYTEVDTRAAKLEFYCNFSTLFPKSCKLLSDMIMENGSCWGTNEVDECNFALHAIILVDAFERYYKGFLSNLFESSSDIKAQLLKDASRVKCKASYQIKILGSLDSESIIGSDYSVQNRHAFRFTPSLALTDPIVKSSLIGTNNGAKDTRRKVADKILLMASSKSSDFLLIVDAEELLILKPNATDRTVGTILCCTLLNNIIAIASDEEWLHIAMRNVEDVGVLIAKGNMALKFENASTCYAAKECISNSRNQWRMNMKEKIFMFLDQCGAVSEHKF